MAPPTYASVVSSSNSKKSSPGKMIEVTSNSPESVKYFFGSRKSHKAAVNNKPAADELQNAKDKNDVKIEASESHKSVNAAARDELQNANVAVTANEKPVIGAVHELQNAKDKNEASESSKSVAVEIKLDISVNPGMDDESVDGKDDEGIVDSPLSPPEEEVAIDSGHLSQIDENPAAEEEDDDSFNGENNDDSREGDPISPDTNNDVTLESNAEDEGVEICEAGNNFTADDIHHDIADPDAEFLKICENQDNLENFKTFFNLLQLSSGDKLFWKIFKNAKNRLPTIDPSKPLSDLSPIHQTDLERAFRQLKKAMINAYNARIFYSPSHPPASAPPPPGITAATAPDGKFVSRVAETPNNLSPPNIVHYQTTVLPTSIPLYNNNSLAQVIQRYNIASFSESPPEPQFIAPRIINVHQAPPAAVYSQYVQPPPPQAPVFGQYAVGPSYSSPRIFYASSNDYAHYLTQRNIALLDEIRANEEALSSILHPASPYERQPDYNL